MYLLYCNHNDKNLHILLAVPVNHKACREKILGSVRISTHNKETVVRQKTEKVCKYRIKLLYPQVYRENIAWADMNCLEHGIRDKNSRKVNA
jgi:hypothetical protein